MKPPSAYYPHLPYLTRQGLIAILPTGTIAHGCGARDRRSDRIVLIGCDTGPFCRPHRNVG